MSSYKRPSEGGEVEEGKKRFKWESIIKIT
jgi:hypothetical protein